MTKNERCKAEITNRKPCQWDSRFELIDITFSDGKDFAYCKDIPFEVGATSEQVAEYFNNMEPKYGNK